MPKLCQHQILLIKENISQIYGHYEVVSDQSTQDDVDEIVNNIRVAIESDCVCSKEENKRTPSDKCLHGYDLTESCKHCDWDNKYGRGEEKKSQSHCEHEKSKGANSTPSKTEHNRFLVEDQLGYFSKEEKKECEHAPADVKQGWVFNSLTSYPLWLCHKCGLVTCKNPNN